VTKKTRRVALWFFIAALVAVAGLAAAFLRRSGGVWVVREVPRPEGWPEATPVGQVEVKRYPAYRAAVTRTGGPESRGAMFRALFDHIKERDIGMTAPVELQYDSAGADEPNLEAMAFVYRHPDQGAAGDDGPVAVRDIAPTWMATMGVRGDYSDPRFERSLAKIRRWLDQRSDRYAIAGAPRYLGYNGPFTPSFLRYGEVQVPVRRLDPTR
jgi:hypothetical protein